MFILSEKYQKYIIQLALISINVTKEPKIFSSDYVT